jgi:hypothetical protein
MHWYIISSNGTLLSKFRPMSKDGLFYPTKVELRTSPIKILKVKDKSEVRDFLISKGYNIEINWNTFETQGLLEIFYEYSPPNPFMETPDELERIFYTLVDVNHRELSPVKRLLKLEILQNDE